jgi:hypothetical protein
MGSKSQVPRHLRLTRAILVVESMKVLHFSELPLHTGSQTLKFQAWHGCLHGTTFHRWSLGLVLRVGSNRWSGRFLGIIGRDPSILQVQPVTCWHPSTFLYKFEVHFINSSKVIGNSLKVLNFNWSFLKLNQFIYNQPPVLPDHRVQQTS